MKILSIGNFSNPSWDGSRPDEEHIAKALEELGHEVIRQQREDDNLNTGGTINTGQTDDVDFILIAQWGDYPVDMITNLKKTFDVPVVYWAFDYQNDGQEWHERLIKGADLYLSKRIADSKYPNWRWLSQDFAPQFLDKIESGTKDIDVLFTGSYLPWSTERNETLKAIDDNFNLVIHSVNSWDGFKDVRPPIMDEGLPELYARTRVIISIDHTIEAGYWSDRNAQIMACGGLVLFRHVPMSESVFRNNIAYFYNKEDCLDKLHNLLQPQFIQLREEYSRKGYEYAQQNLKVTNRVMDLLTIVGSIL